MDYTSILRYLETVTATTADYILINTGGNNKKITLNNFITTLGLGGGGGGQGVTIPPLKLKVGKFDNTLKTNPISVAYYDSFNTDWKNYNPEVWLFRLTNRSFKSVGGIKKIRPRAFRHPTDLNWATKTPIVNEFGTRLYAGENDHKHTEWQILNSDTSYNNISSFNFDVFEFYDRAAGAYPCSFNDWGRPKGRGRRKTNQKVVHFLFRIVIRNPNNPNKVIFGPATNVLKASPTKQGVIMSELMFNKLSYL